MQGFGMGRYRPPSSDPRLQPFNSTHPLGSRARKFYTEGILIVRFELPFHLFCSHCSTHIAQGTRFNAEKKLIGEYMSSKIWSFSCKCMQCGGRFEIKTDPKNAKYVVGEGCRERCMTWDPETIGGHAIFDNEQRKEKEEDAFANLDKKKQEEKKEKQRQSRIFQLESHSQKNWSDPYTLNSQLRSQFRKEKRRRTEQLEKDLNLKQRIGWNEDQVLVSPSTPATEKRDGERWKEAQLLARKETGMVKGKEKQQTAAQNLKERLMSNSRKKNDPFLQHITSFSPSSASTLSTSLGVKAAKQPKQATGSHQK